MDLRNSIVDTKKNGIINKEGRVVIPAIHKDVSVNIDVDSLYFRIVGNKNKSDWFMTDKHGKTIGAPCDSILTGFVNGLCCVKIKGKWGYINTSGDMIIKPQYDYARVFTENGVARVKKGKEYFFIDKAGNQILKYDNIFTGFSKNRAAVLIDGEKLLINRQGEVICKINADKIYSFRDDNYAVIVKNDKASLIDTLGNIVIATEYQSIGVFNNGIAPVVKDGKVGFIDITGKEIIPVKYSGCDFLVNEAPIRSVNNKQL